MKKLTAEQFKEYAANPLVLDEKVRKLCEVPEDKYYTVAIWPEERSGELQVTSTVLFARPKSQSPIRHKPIANTIALWAVC